MKSRKRLGAWCLLLLVVAASCRNRETRPYREPPPLDIPATQINYVESDGFDALLETALTNQEPVIRILTTHTKPDWGGRLNAWLAAWNRGGQVQPTGTMSRFRGQIPIGPQVVIDGESLREFRILIETLMNRVEDVARERSAWWTEEKTQARRIALLKPYNLRFHMDDDGFIQIIFFNGKYSQYHKQFVQAIARPDEHNGEDWDRSVHCSMCKRRGTATE